MLQDPLAVRGKGDRLFRLREAELHDLAFFLGGSWDLVSRNISTLIRVISEYTITIVTLFITLLTKSPLIL